MKKAQSKTKKRLLADRPYFHHQRLLIDDKKDSILTAIIGQLARICLWKRLNLPAAEKDWQRKEMKNQGNET
jgi:hypothetical protein